MEPGAGNTSRMKNPFEVYQTFLDHRAAKKVGRKLRYHGIPYEIRESPTFDPSFSNSPFYKEFSLKLLLSDFERANEILDKISEADLEKLPKEYYLFSFSNTELLNIVTHKDEWNPIDYKLALHLLNERGHIVTDQTVKELNDKRIKELSQPERTKDIWILVSYILAILIGFIGLFVGWNMAFSKKTLPNGQQVYAYVDSERKHGQIILIISIISSLIFIVRVLTPQFQN